MRPIRAFSNRAVQLLSTALLSVTLLAGCEGIDTEKANKNVDEANTRLKEGDALEAEGTKLLNEINSAESPEKAKDSAGKCVAKFDEAGKKYDEAAKLTKDASGMKVTKMFAEYLDIKGKQFAKIGESAQIWKALCKTGADSGTVLKVDGDKSKADAEKLQEEAKELNAKAEKIQKDNPDQFKN